MTLTIDGVNVIPYVASGGLSFQRTDVEGDNGGRTLGGTTIRDRIAQKRRLDVTCRPLGKTECATVLSLLAPESIFVTFSDPVTGGETTAEMYVESVPAQFLFQQKGGRELWGGVTFTLMER